MAHSGLGGGSRGARTARSGPFCSAEWGSAAEAKATRLLWIGQRKSCSALTSQRPHPIALTAHESVTAAVKAERGSTFRRGARARVERARLLPHQRQGAEQSGDRGALRAPQVDRLAPHPHAHTAGLSAVRREHREVPAGEDRKSTRLNSS